MWVDINPKLSPLKCRYAWVIMAGFIANLENLENLEKPWIWPKFAKPWKKPWKWLWNLENLENHSILAARFQKPILVLFQMCICCNWVNMLRHGSSYQLHFVPKPSVYEGAQICLKGGYFCWKLLAVFKTVLRYTKLWAEVDILNFLSSACYS